MDRTVPPAAAALLTEIYKYESGSNYNAISSFKQHKLPKAVTKYSIGELLNDMGTWSKRFGTLSSAAGAPQIIKATLQGLVVELGLSRKQKFDADLQDRLAYHLLRRRGYDAWVQKRISSTEFAKRLAMEWASLPVLAGTKNYKGVNIKRGTSYYAGDGLNKEGVTADKWERVLNSAINKQPELDLKAPDTKSTVATKTIVVASTGAAIVGGANEAAQTVTDWAPILELTSSIAKYGPAVAGGVVLGVVLIVIARKVFK